MLPVVRCIVFDPNGADKSMTISMLTTQLEAIGGEIYPDGHSVIGDSVRAHAEIGVVAQHNVGWLPMRTFRLTLVTSGWT